MPIARSGVLPPGDGRRTFRRLDLARLLRLRRRAQLLQRRPVLRAAGRGTRGHDRIAVPGERSPSSLPSPWRRLTATVAVHGKLDVAVDRGYARGRAAAVALPAPPSRGWTWLSVPLTSRCAVMVRPGRAMAMPTGRSLWRPGGPGAVMAHTTTTVAGYSLGAGRHRRGCPPAPTWPRDDAVRLGGHDARAHHVRSWELIASAHILPRWPTASAEGLAMLEPM